MYNWIHWKYTPDYFAHSSQLDDVHYVFTSQVIYSLSGSIPNNLRAGLVWSELGDFSIYLYL